jgi:hypothetical protein
MIPFRHLLTDHLHLFHHLFHPHNLLLFFFQFFRQLPNSVLLRLDSSDGLLIDFKQFFYLLVDFLFHPGFFFVVFKDDLLGVLLLLFESGLEGLELLLELLGLGENGAVLLLEVLDGIELGRCLGL